MEDGRVKYHTDQPSHPACTTTRDNNSKHNNTTKSFKNKGQSKCFTSCQHFFIFINKLSVKSDTSTGICRSVNSITDYYGFYLLLSLHVTPLESGVDLNFKLIFLRMNLWSQTFITERSVNRLISQQNHTPLLQTCWFI